MYPVTLGYDEAVRRIKKLSSNGHHAEALITAVFTTEKTIRRTLRFMAVSRGFTSKHSDLLFHKKGFKDIKDVWPCFDREHRTLPEIIGTHWQHIDKAVTMRNKMAHGERVYPLKECREQTDRVLLGLNALQQRLKHDYQFDGWSRAPTRIKPRLQWIEFKPPCTSSKKKP